VRRKTAQSRLIRAITTIGDWLDKHCHWSIGEQHQI
jgi:hypothetical protein